MWKLNGKTLRPGDLAKHLKKAVDKAALEGVRRVAREKLQPMRLPGTGEFPTVVLEGKLLNDLQARIEGSPELLNLVKSRLSSTGQADRSANVRPKVDQPYVFLSYGGEDAALAKAIAHAFMAQGIPTWFAPWEISFGDSLRQQIDAGLHDCTHFVVLLTKTSIHKPWVRQEMDAGLVRRLAERCAFIPLRHQLAASELPPLLSGMRSPEVDEAASNLDELIHHIHSVDRKPALGAAPAIARMPATDYTPAATAIARRSH